MLGNKIKNIGISLACIGAIAGMTQQANAQPMFAKQTGMDCAACHLQSMPKLNKFGRKFMTSGMTLSKKVSDAESDINAGLVFKTKYEKTWDKPNGNGTIQVDGTNDGEFDFMRASILSVAGRIDENLGGMINVSQRTSDSEGAGISGKVVYAKEVEGGYWGVAAYSNDTQGPFSGMEPYNTGLYKPLRNFDMHKFTNANQVTKLGSLSATGVQLYFDKDGFIGDGDHFFITAGVYLPGQDNADIQLGDVVIPFGRVAYEYMIGNYNVILGGFAIKGGETVSATENLSLERETYGMDLQVEGTLFDKEATLIMTNVFKNKLTFTGIGANSQEVLKDIYGEAFSAEGDISLTDDVYLKLGYMTYNDRLAYDKVSHINVKDIDYALSMGVDYSFMVIDTNMKLALEYAWMEPSLDRVENYSAFMATLTTTF